MMLNVPAYTWSQYKHFDFRARVAEMSTIANYKIKPGNRLIYWHLSWIGNAPKCVSRMQYLLEKVQSNVKFSFEHTS